MILYLGGGFLLLCCLAAGALMVHSGINQGRLSNLIGGAVLILVALYVARRTLAVSAALRAEEEEAKAGRRQTVAAPPDASAFAPPDAVPPIPDAAEAKRFPISRKVLARERQMYEWGMVGFAAFLLGSFANMLIWPLAGARWDIGAAAAVVCVLLYQRFWLARRLAALPYGWTDITTVTPAGIQGAYRTGRGSRLLFVPWEDMDYVWTGHYRSPFGVDLVVRGKRHSRARPQQLTLPLYHEDQAGLQKLVCRWAPPGNPLRALLLEQFGGANPGTGN